MLTTKTRTCTPTVGISTRLGCGLVGKEFDNSFGPGTLQGLCVPYYVHTPGVKRMMKW